MLVPPFDLGGVLAEDVYVRAIWFRLRGERGGGGSLKFVDLLDMRYCVQILQLVISQ